MTTVEISKYIHEQIMGLCWHEGGGVYVREKCNKCETRRRITDKNPDYCSDDSPRSLLNEVVAKVIDVVPPTMLMCRVSDILEPKFDYMWPEYQLTMSAEQIARTCVKSHQAK